MLVGMDHMQIAMPVGGEGAARRFYGEILGLAEVAKPQPLAVRGGCWFVGPGIQIHMGAEAGFTPARKAHPAFLVADLEACRAALEAAGVATRPDSEVPGVRRFYADDPFGNRVEFIQQGDGFSQANWYGAAP
jgi:catechol 2,3-dioxygenase-like lactoylglutathione lyase family enzyme